MTFEVGDSREIMKDSKYGGVQIPIDAHLGRMELKLKIDISTGDAIAPSKVAFQFPLLLEDRKIDIWANNLETVLAEKAETIIMRGVLNTRMRDFYDIFMLSTVYDPINAAIFRDAIRAVLMRAVLMRAVLMRAVLISDRFASPLKSNWRRGNA